MTQASDFSEVFFAGSACIILKRLSGTGIIVRWYSYQLIRKSARGDRMKQPKVEVVFQKGGKTFLEQLKEIVRIKTAGKKLCVPDLKR